MLGAGRLYAPSLQGRRALLLPAGVLVYIAVPPARDFATSGLENGLVLAYLGLLWWMMVCWSQALRAYPDARAQIPPTSSARLFDAALAFVAGLSVLVRPELALVGGLALVMMLIAARGWRAPDPDRRWRADWFRSPTRSSGWATTDCFFPERLWRRTPSGDKWSQGWIYLTNFNQPYLLWLPALLLAVLALVLLANRGRPWWIRRPTPYGYSRLARDRAEPARGGDLHRRQRAAAGPVLDSPGRRLHARQGPAHAAVLSAGAGGGDPGAVAGRRQVQPRSRISVRRRDRGAVAGGGRLVVVGGELAGHGCGRHPGDLHGHRRRTAVLLPGHRPRASADRRRLSGLSADARGAGRAQQHPRRRAAAAFGQLRPCGTWCPQNPRRPICRPR